MRCSTRQQLGAMVLALLPPLSWALTGLMLGQTYSIFVVAFGPEGAPVLPSANSNIELISLREYRPELMNYSVPYSL